MSFVFPGEKSLDYFPCQYGKSRLQLRGPKREVAGPYVAVLGGTETYGKFVPVPYPALLERGIALPTLNLGCMNSGPDVYLNDPEMMGLACRAAAVVVQIVGAQNISNGYYWVHPRRNDRFLGATPMLRALFPKVDFTEFNFTRHMLVALQRACPDRFEVIAEALRAAWVLRMQQLLAGLKERAVLLWMSNTAPPHPERRVDLNQTPLLIDSEMIAAVGQHASSYVEVVYSDEGKSRGCEGMAFAAVDSSAAEELPSPALHAEVAAALLPRVTTILK